MILCKETKMIKWEYMQYTLYGDREDDIAKLNEFGQEGWELVTIDKHYIATLKRRVPRI
jgi:hypothetical protein